MAAFNPSITTSAATPDLASADRAHRRQVYEAQVCRAMDLVEQKVSLELDPPRDDLSDCEEYIAITQELADVHARIDAVVDTFDHEDFVAAFSRLEANDTKSVEIDGENHA